MTRDHGIQLKWYSMHNSYRPVIENDADYFYEPSSSKKHTGISMFTINSPLTRHLLFLIKSSVLDYFQAMQTVCTQVTTISAITLVRRHV